MSSDPRATYRIQQNKDFDFDATAGITPYLAALGISHLYSSPLLQAAPGSTHGYDVVDPHAVNRELGGDEGFARLQRALGAHGLGIVLDIVPNHMAISGRENAWWWDVLENGPSSAYARYFDIDWEPQEANLLRSPVLMPILGEHYGEALQAGKIRLNRDRDSFTISYFDQVLPVAPRSLERVLSLAAARAFSDDLAFLADAFDLLPPATTTKSEAVARRTRDIEKLRALLAEWVDRDPHLARTLDAVVAEINANPVALDDLLERQNYRLTYWRVAERELDYRRFFDINSLVGVRNEDPEVFADTHQMVLAWLRDGVLDGLRVDHIDGLRDPDTYLGRLREQSPRAWIIVEKILEPGEALPPSWPIAGTTGYDFLNDVNGLFVASDGEEAMTQLYRDFTGETTDYPALLREKKLLVLRSSLNSDVNRLTALWLSICQRNWRYRDATWHEAQTVLCEVIADFPVYRTYVRPDENPDAMVRPEDRAYIEQAVGVARTHLAEGMAHLLDFLGDMLLLRTHEPLETEFLWHFQQVTGPAMAKGAEDTAFYVYNRLISLNEVGGDPGRFGVAPADFHAVALARQRRWPQAMLASSTHDTKRSEDVRARINLLSEMPTRWAETVARWSERTRQAWGEATPDHNAEYLFYQTLVGAWPLSPERAWAFMEKAAREAKVHTTWAEPNVAYEDGLHAFVERVLADGEFVADLERFIDDLRDPWYTSALAQTLIKLSAPGVPDIYQGSELWDLSLVDPDNRRPVDYALRERLLAEVQGMSPEVAWERRTEGLPKLYLICHALGLRQRRPEPFGLRATYLPLEAHGMRAEHVLAFARGQASQSFGPGQSSSRNLPASPESVEVVAVAPRLVLSLGGDWGDTTIDLPPGRWRDELSGETYGSGAVALSALLRRFPVALLARDDGPGEG